jgi:hypothetical protein
MDVLKGTEAGVILVIGIRPWSMACKSPSATCGLKSLPQAADVNVNSEK